MARSLAPTFLSRSLHHSFLVLSVLVLALGAAKTRAEEAFGTGLAIDFKQPVVGSRYIAYQKSGLGKIFDLDTREVFDTGAVEQTAIISGDLVAVRGWGSLDPLLVFDGRTRQISDLSIRADPLFVGQDRVLSLLVEAVERVDYNRDGDMVDNFFFDYDVATTTLQGIEAPPYRLLTPVRRLLRGRFFVFGVEENNRVDLNGDGDRIDRILQVYDLSLRRLINTGRDAGLVEAPDERFLATTHDETLSGDVNGDGVLDPRLTLLTDTRTRAVHELGATTALVRSNGRAVIFLSLGSRVAHVFFPDTGRIESLSLFAFGPVLGDRYFAFTVPERDQKQDVNGDGDRVDELIYVYDTETRALEDLGLQGHVTHIVGDVLWLAVAEYLEEEDLDGDGRTDGWVLHTVDMKTGELTNHGVPPAFKVSGDDGFFFIPEQRVGDRNNDGDTEDLALVTLHRPTGILTDYRLASSLRGLPSSAYPVSVPGGRFLAPILEEEIGRDLDGDLVEDDLVFVLLDPSCALRREGTVNAGRGSVADVLLLNESAGSGRERVVEYGILSPFRLRVRRPPALAAPDTAPFAVYAWVGEPSRSTARPLPFAIGHSVMPMPLTGGAPGPVLIWNNAGRPGQLGVPHRFSVPAPSVLVDLPRGPRRAIPFTIQGLIFDPGSASTVPASVTNAIVARPVPRR